MSRLKRKSSVEQGSCVVKMNENKMNIISIVFLMHTWMIISIFLIRISNAQHPLHDDVFETSDHHNPVPQDPWICVQLKQSEDHNLHQDFAAAAAGVVPPDQCTQRCSACFEQWTKNSHLFSHGKPPQATTVTKEVVNPPPIASISSSVSGSPPVVSSSSSSSSSLSSPVVAPSSSSATAQQSATDSSSNGNSSPVVQKSPSMGINFRRTWGIITAISSGIGVVCVLICAIYFLMVFPVRVGTTILGYMILFGLLIVYLVNFTFILPPTNCICWLRKLGMSLGYCTILSGMLVKVMNTWRRLSIKSRSQGDLRMSSPQSLLFVAGGLVSVHVSATVVWLYLFPPQAAPYKDTWRCYPPSSSGFLLDTESVVSLLFLILLITMVMFFSVLTWKSSDSNREPRFIFYSCAFMAIVWMTWTVVTLRMKRKLHPETRDVTVICANLASASFVMILLYLRKLYWYSKIKRKDKLIRSRLQATTFPANFYGALHSRSGSAASFGYPWDAMSVASGPSTVASSVRGSVSSLAMRTTENREDSKKSFEGDDTISCGSAASSVQVQGTDLYPMDVYDVGSQFEPSSLFAGGRSYGKGDE